MVDLQCCVDFRCRSQRFSFIYTHTHTFFFNTLFLYTLSQEGAGSSLCHVGGPCWLSISYMKVKRQLLSYVRLFATLWIVAHCAPLSMGFSRKEYWSGLPFSSPGDLPDPRIETACLTSPALAGGFFTTEPPGKPCKQIVRYLSLELAFLI